MKIRRVMFSALPAIIAIILFQGSTGKFQSNPIPVNFDEDEDDAASLDPSGGVRTILPFPDSEIGDVLRHHMSVLHGVGDDAEEIYLQSLAGIRSFGPLAVSVLKEAYFSLQEDNYIERWSVVQVIAALEIPEASSFLMDLAGTPIPQEKMPPEDTHDISTVDEEIAIRFRAVAGLTLLATSGHAPSEAALLQIALDSSLEAPVRRSATMGLIQQGYARSEVAELLEEEMRWMAWIEEMPPEVIDEFKADIDSYVEDDVPEP